MYGLMDLTSLLPLDFNVSLLSCFHFSDGLWKAVFPLKEEDLSVVYSYDGKTMEADALDTEGEKFPLFYLPSPGPFSSMVREEVEELLSSLVHKFSPDDSEMRKRVLSLFKGKYGIEGDRPWSDDDESIVLRSKKNNKWIGLLMDIPSSKLGLSGEEKVDVINLKHSQSHIPHIIDRHFVFPAWHMSKKTWITVLLSKELDWEYFTSLVEESRRLVEE